MAQDKLDVTLVCSTGEEFTVARHALEEHSDYFRGLFQSGMRESRSDQVSLPVLSKRGLQICLDSLTEQQLEGNLDLDDLKEVLTAATYLQISTLLTGCINQIAQKLTVDSVDEIEQISSDFSLPQLASLVDQYIRHHLKAFYDAKCYEGLSEERVCSLLAHDDLHVADETIVFDFAVAWIRHEQSKRKLTDETICNVLNTVRFPLMTLLQFNGCEELMQLSGIDKYCTGKLLRDKYETTEAGEESQDTDDTDDAGSSSTPSSGLGISRVETAFLPTPVGRNAASTQEISIRASLPAVEYARQILNRGNKNFVHHVMRSGVHTESVCVRSAVPCVVACGGFTLKESSTNRFQYLPLTELQPKPSNLDVAKRTPRRKAAKVTSVAKFTCHKSSRMLRGPCCEHCVVVADNLLYLLGGQTFYTNDGRFTTDFAARYDPCRGQWDLIESMQKARSLFYAAHVGGYIYAVCGWTFVNTVTKTVERYDLISGTWEYRAPLQIGLHEHAGCVYERALFVSGGYKGPYRGHLDQTWMYDTERDVWTERARMRHARSYHAMGVAADTIIVAGGVNYLGDDTFEDVLSCEIYSVETDEWTIITNCSVPRPASCMPYFVHDDKLYVFGGHSFASNNDHSWILVLDMKQLTWSELAEYEASGIRHFSTAIMDLPRTVKPVYKDHPWSHEKVASVERWSL